MSDGCAGCCGCGCQDGGVDEDCGCGGGVGFGGRGEEWCGGDCVEVRIGVDIFIPKSV